LINLKPERPGRLIGPLLGALGLLGSAAFYLAWQLAHRGSYRYDVSFFPLDDADEWRYTACSRLVEHGYAMFTQVFSAQPPLLFASLAEGMRLFGDSIAGARWVEVLFGLLGLIATVGLAWLLSGPVAAGATGLLLAVSPLFLVYSRAVEAEGPMMALTALCLALALGYRRATSPILPILSGLTLAAAVLFKLFALEAVLPALWIMWLPEQRATSLRAVGSFLAATIVPVLADFLLVSPTAQWYQVVNLHQRAASAALPGLLSPLQIFRDLVATDPGLVVLAAAGLAVLAVLAVWEDAVFLLLWVGGTLAMLTVFRPLFPHHAVILLPGLAVCAGVAVTVLVEQLRSHRWVAAIPLAAAALLYLALTPRLAHADRHVLIPGLPASEVQGAAYVRAHTSAADIVASDNAQIADLASRLVPAPLCDLSNVRFRSGYSSASTLIRSTRDYHARMVIAWPGGIFTQAQGYLPWVRRHYRFRREVAGTQIYSATHQSP
jgi:4-amino-4-deoxy-L-arabinose transferase-like glycosyltransferase